MSGPDLHDSAAENVSEIESRPHDWLFPQCAAVVHHGGASTLAAGFVVAISIGLDEE